MNDKKGMKWGKALNCQSLNPKPKTRDLASNIRNNTSHSSLMLEMFVLITIFIRF